MRLLTIQNSSTFDIIKSGKYFECDINAPKSRDDRDYELLAAKLSEKIGTEVERVIFTWAQLWKSNAIPEYIYNIWRFYSVLDGDILYLLDIPDENVLLACFDSFTDSMTDRDMDTIFDIDNSDVVMALIRGFSLKNVIASWKISKYPMLSLKENTLSIDKNLKEYGMVSQKFIAWDVKELGERRGRLFDAIRHTSKHGWADIDILLNTLHTEGLHDFYSVIGIDTEVNREELIVKRLKKWLGND